VPVEHVRWRTRPQLDRPVLIAAFEGWNDAGDAASSAVRYLVERNGAELVADIDPEEFLDFTSTRPHARVDDDGHRVIDWPTIEFYAGQLPGGAGDALLLLGSEPQLKWRTFCEQVVAIARELDCRLVLTLGAVIAEVPHSRPVPVVGSVSDTALQADLGLPASTYEGPTGIVGVLSAAMRDAGVPSASLWAAVPTYVPTAPSPKAALALVERVGEVLDTWLPTTDLEIAAASYERQVTELVEEDDETSDYVSRLESRHDDDQEVSGTSLVEEVERYLRRRLD
jgi:proteasome assembly chaperone (PAC2) family protein